MVLGGGYRYLGPRGPRALCRGLREFMVRSCWVLFVMDAEGSVRLPLIHGHCNMNSPTRHYVRVLSFLMRVDSLLSNRPMV